MYLNPYFIYNNGRYPMGASSGKIPLPVTRASRKLGRDIRDARRRRRIPVAILAERASISRTTLNKIEKGDPGVSLGHYATVLFALGMAERLADVADARHDSVGLALEEEHLPKRIRLSRSPKPAGPKSPGEPHG
jgi:transcriptional regulator with XRE-family HTH domain